MAMQTGPNNTLTVSGHVTDMVEGGAVVTISGVASGTATTDASGNYSLVVQASAQGTITASATDIWGLVSTVVQTNYTSQTSQPPVITSFNASLSSGGIWVFTGTVTDQSLVGLTVTLSGVVGGTCTVRSDGTFEYDSSLTYGAAGGAEFAKATDALGNVSNTAQCWVA